MGIHIYLNSDTNIPNAGSRPEVRNCLILVLFRIPRRTLMCTLSVLIGPVFIPAEAVDYRVEH